jgi:hypothetical protein
VWPWEDLSVTLLVLFLLLGCHEVSSFPPPCLFAMMYLLCHESKSNGSSQAWTETPETVSQNKSFLFLNCFSQVFVTAMKN